MRVTVGKRDAVGLMLRRRDDRKKVTAELNIAADLSIVDTVFRTETFQTFSRLIEGSSLEEKLRGPRSYTLFVPIDRAFSDPNSSILATLLESKNGWMLSAVLGYHVVPGRITLRELGKLRTLRTEVGQILTISDFDCVKINEARVVVSDIEARNGMIHGIDALLMPQIPIQSRARNQLGDLF